MMSEFGKITVEFGEDAKRFAEFVNATRIPVCFAHACVNNNVHTDGVAECQLKSVEIKRDGRCASFKLAGTE
jgi:hypothetical protein